MSFFRRRQLQQATYENTKPLDFSDFETKAKVVKVYDADTIHVVFYFRKKLTRFCVRLAGIDAPELRSLNQNEREAALAAKHCVENFLKDHEIIKLKCAGMDKYGRILGHVFLKGRVPSLNSLLVSTGYAYEYDGGTRKRFEDWWNMF